MEERSYGFVPLRRSEQGYELLVIRALRTGLRSFPKGHIHPNETPIQTAIRELWEETGYVPVSFWTGSQWSNDKEQAILVSTIQYRYVKHTGESGEKEVSLYMAIVEQRGEVQDHSEIEGIEWHPFHSSSLSVFQAEVKRTEFQQHILPLLAYI